MKILFIRSGYPGVYLYIEEAIKKAFQALSIDLCQNDAIPLTAYAELEQICRTERPTFIFTLLGYKLPQRFLNWVQKSKIPFVLWQTEDPYLIDKSIEIAPFATHILTIEKQAWQHYQQQGWHALHLPLGADYSIFKPMKQNPNIKSDLCLIGYAYPERVDLITYLAKALPVNITVAGNWSVHLLPNNVRMASTWLSPLETASYYSNSKIVLNSYRRLAQKENKNSLLLEGISPNNRVFEVAGCYACQLSEKRADWDNWFNAEDVATFTTKEDLVEQAKELLQNSQQRQDYAKNSYQTATTRHSYVERLHTFLDWFQQ